MGTSMQTQTQTQTIPSPIIDLYNYPEIFDKISGDTYAMVYANAGKIPPPEVTHSPTIRNNSGNTVAMLLARNNGNIPSQWQHDPSYCNGKVQTVAMILTATQKPVPSEWEHDPYITDVYGHTVAMLQAFFEKVPTHQWWHEPGKQSSKGYTVAMFLLCRGIVPPPEWRHNKELKSFIPETTVKLIAGERGMDIDQFWEKKYGVYDNNDNICMICLMGGDDNDWGQKFVKTKCGHKICCKCSMMYNRFSCPYCKVVMFRIEE